MAIDKGGFDHGGFASKLPKEISHFRLRELNWLWTFLSQSNIWFWNLPWPPESSISLEQKAAYITQQIASHHQGSSIIESVLNTHHMMIIEQKYFDWIDQKDGRLLIWLIGQACVNGILSTTQIFSATRYDFFIKYLDLSPLSADFKMQFLVNCKDVWGQTRTPDSQAKWIKASDEVQIRWAWSYLCKFYKAVVISTPVTKEEIYDAVLASIDQMSYENPAYKELFLVKMRKTWSQKKFRDSGKAKKPYHLPLTEPTKKKLDELAKLHNIKSIDILEALIKETYAKDIEDEKGKKQYKPQ